MSWEDDAAAIRRHMAEVRQELHEDIQDAAESTRQLSDWRRYVKMYPVATLAAAFAVGYWIVPRRGPSVRLTADSISGLSLPEPPKKKSSDSMFTNLIGSVFGVASKFAMRYAMGFAGAQLTKMLSKGSPQHPFSLPQSHDGEGLDEAYSTFVQTR